MFRGHIKADPEDPASKWVVDDTLLLFEEEEGFEAGKSIMRSLGVRFTTMPRGKYQDGRPGHFILWVEADIDWDVQKEILGPWFEVRE